MKNLSKAIALVGAMTASTAAFAEGHEGHAVEVSASAGVATSYLFRGLQLGGGSPMVYGDLTAAAGGAYASIWVAGGDDALGTEYDLIVGYGGEAGDFSYDINLTNYVYTATPAASAAAGVVDSDVTDFSEAILSLGYGDFGVTYAANITGNGVDYYAASYGTGDFGFTVGKFEDGDTHVDVSYAASENITFVASQVVDADDGVEDDVIFVVDVALPL